MTEECPVSCQKQLGHIEDDVKGLKTSIYGEDGLGGLAALYTNLKACMAKYITKKTLSGSILGVLTILAVFVVYSMGSFAAEKEKIIKNTEGIKTHKQEMVHIKEDIKAINTKVEAIFLKQVKIENTVKTIEREQTSKKEMEEMLKNAMETAIKESKK